MRMLPSILALILLLSSPAWADLPPPHVATSTEPGYVQPDNSTITVDPGTGVIHAAPPVILPYGSPMAVVGDSITELNDEITSQFAITAIAGNSYFLVTSTGALSQPSTYSLSPGDTVTLCSTAACTAITENHVVASTFQQAGAGFCQAGAAQCPTVSGWVVPITDTIVSSSVTYANWYTERFNQNGQTPWLVAALNRMSNPLVLGGYTNYLSNSVINSCVGGSCPQHPVYSGIFGRGGATCEQLAGLAQYSEQGGSVSPILIPYTINFVQAALSMVPHPALIGIACGTNDVKATVGTPIATVKQTILSMATQVIQGGSAVAISTILPAGSSVYGVSCDHATTYWTDAAQGELYQLNQWIRSLGKNGITINGITYPVIVVDVYRALADPQTGQYANAGPLSTAGYGGAYGALPQEVWTTDCVHPGTWGGMWQMASAWINALSPHVTSVSTLTGSLLSGADPQISLYTQTVTQSMDWIYSSVFGPNPYGNDIPNAGMSNQRYYTARVNGANGVATANALSLKFTLAGQPGSPRTITYNTVTGDTNQTAAMGLATAINTDADIPSWCGPGAVQAASMDATVVIYYPSVAASGCAIAFDSSGSVAPWGIALTPQNPSNSGATATGYSENSTAGSGVYTVVPKSNSLLDYTDRGYWQRIVKTGSPGKQYVQVNDVLYGLNSQFGANTIIPGTTAMYMSARIRMICTSGATQQLQPWLNPNIVTLTQQTTFSGTQTQNDYLTATVVGSGTLSGLNHSVSYQAGANPTATTVAAGLAIAIDNDATFQSYNVSAGNRASGSLYLYDNQTQATQGLTLTVTCSTSQGGSCAGSIANNGNTAIGMNPGFAVPYELSSNYSPSNPAECFSNGVIRTYPWVVPANTYGINAQVGLYGGVGQMDITDFQMRVAQ